MTYISSRKLIASACALVLSSSAVFGDYDVPNPIYAAPGTYYNTATGLAATLKFNLNEIIDGHTVYTYSNSAHDAAMLKLDEDPNNSSNVLLIYSGYSVAKSAVLNTTYNREHIWPNSYGLDDTNAAYSDLFNLRVCDAGVNSARNNDYYDDVPSTIARHVGHPDAPDTWEDDAQTKWEPRDVEKGELARTLFYMDTRYEGQTNDGFARDLTLTDTISSINSSNNNMGKLTTLLHWNYEHGISNRERRRTHLTYTNDTGVNGWNGTARNQGNRNPFVDHPEYIWAVFGGTTNNSKLYVTASAPSNGASATTVDLGRVIVGQTLGTGSFTLSKAGANPTTYDMTIAGDVTTSAAGTGQMMPYDPTTRTVTVGLTSSTATAGLKSGTVTIDNTDITNAGATGSGSADGNDVVTVSANVLSHSKPSLNSPTQSTSATVNFGLVAQGTGTQALPFSIYNLVVTAGFTAGLDIDTFNGTGSTSVLTTNLAVLSNILAGSSQLYSASLNTNTNGTYSATYTIANSDENIPGATNGTPLILTITGQVDTRQWRVNTDGNWSTAANWLGPVPTNSGDTANFLNFITAPKTITLDSDKSAGIVTFDSAQKYTIAGTTSTLTLAGAGSASVTVVAGNHDITAPVAFTSPTTVSVASGSKLLISKLQASTTSLTKTNTGTLEVNAVRASALAVNAGKIEITANGGANSVSKIASITIPTGSGVQYAGTLDLHDNDLVVDYEGGTSPYATIINLVKAGLTSLGGDGSGITSSELNAGALPGAAFGIVDIGDPNKAVPVGSISGFSDYSTTSILIKYTWNGDANLDGEVTGSDYALVDTGFASAIKSGWGYGDFNYDNIVDGTDYSLIDSGFASQAGTLPEPTVLSLAAIPLMQLLRRRRR